MSEGKTPRKSGDGEASDALDAALAAWPTLPGNELEADDTVRRVLSLIASDQSTRLAQLSPPVSDDALVRPPLPALPGEGQSAAVAEPRRARTGMTAASREQNRANLRELARLASASLPPGSVSAPPSSWGPSASEEKTEREESSGVIHLGALRAVNALAGGQDAGPSRSPSAPPFPGSSLPLPRESTGKTNRSWGGIASVVAAAAVAAGVFFTVRHPAHDEGVGALAVAPSPAPPVTVAPTGAAASPGIPVASGSPDDRGIQPTALPPAFTAAVATRGATPVSVPAGSKPTVPASSARTTTAPALLAAVPTAAPASPSASASLQTLMQQAAGVTSAPAAPAAASPDAPPEAVGSVPLRPSQGALQGALGAALPGARACLGPDDPISHATITFASDGSVVDVGISGGAAGKPAEGCIRAALMKTRVAPFARPTFTGTATVRPN